MLYNQIHSIIYYSSIILLVFCLILGTKNLKKLGDLRSIYYLLILSFIQILISEILYAILYSLHPELENLWRQNGYKVTNIYIVLEFIIIVTFFQKLKKQKNRITSSALIFVFAAVSYFIPLINEDLNGFIHLKYFSLTSGLIILLLSINRLYSILKIMDYESSEDKTIFWVCLGIFLANIILWPTSVIQSLVKNDFNYYYKLSVIANSTGYIIMYLFSAISFYEKSRSRIY
jgi:hypothetical protein